MNIKEAKFYIRMLKQQIEDAYKEGKLDTLTYNSMIITLHSIENSLFEKY